ncbi:MAG: hypothetical protein PUA52_04570 [Lachnospiraceae bacterium]|nr:hypothetical protein [Lachnospiraceae bacterium]
MINAILDEILTCFEGIDEGQAEDFCRLVRSSRRLFNHPKGRMGMAMKAFGALLEDIIPYYVIGDTGIPAIGEGDLLLVAPTGGDPRSSTRFINIARDRGARVAAFTANRQGPIGTMADCFIEVSARTMLPGDETPSLQPMCSTMEQAGLLFFDMIYLMLKDPTLTTAVARQRISEGLRASLGSLNPAAEAGMQALKAYLPACRRLFFDGDTREKQILCCFAMRLFHMGEAIRVPGEISAGHPASGDGLILAGADVTDPAFRFRVETAKRAGAAVFLITDPAGRRALPGDLAAAADGIWEIPSGGGARDGDTVGSETAGSLPLIAFTENLLILLDCLVAELMTERGLSERDMAARHTNLE